MAKISIVVLADTETHGDTGRVANAITTARESKEAGDEVEIIFDGAGTRWIPELENEDHKMHSSFEAVRDTVTGACEFCAGAFGVKEAVRSAGVPLLDEYHEHPSLRTRVADGYHVITF